MSKVATTYWDNDGAVSIPKLRTRPRNIARMKTNRESATPPWFIFAVIFFSGFLLCLTVNFRAFSELNSEIEANQKLNIEVEQLSNHNLMIEEQIKNLKSDPKVIELEARKLRMVRPEEKVFMPTN